MAAFFTYKPTIEDFGAWIAFGCAAAVWLIVGLYLKHAEFKGAPKNIQFIDP